ncbi:uncharacterized protein LOC110467324 [Mizuhopecten yessoensis]|uniref:uncharacterized protein LOC110467324 n=1 Tax=Mizuhopecten yessoensis TaxID=6573 RepID=UPI000B45DFF3|nr:uncharacterized protein LOC110467324 [Mizuhopecten yessoensis]
MEKVNESRTDNDSDDDSLAIDSDEDQVDDSTEENVMTENHRLWSGISARKEHAHPSSSGIGNYSDYGGPDTEDDLGINMENRNTQRKTDTDIRILIAYLRSLNDSRPPETIPPLELDRYLSNFFTIVKKHDGNEYEPASLRGMLCSVERYLKMKSYQASVTRDVVFVNTRHALKYKQQRLRELGKGSKKPNEPFGKVTLDKVNQLFTAREMGPYTPMSIINSMCFMFIVHFRLRKAIDHKNLVWGDIKLRADQSGKEYILYEPILSRGQIDGATSSSNTQATTANTTNTTSAKPEQCRSSYTKLCIWAQPEVPERDPVGIYKLYSQKRPPNMQHENSPFYLGITTLHPSPVQAWYRTCAMGVNKLSDLVRMIRDITGLPRAALNPPAESLLSESYTTHLPSSSGSPTSHNTLTYISQSPEADRNINAFVSFSHSARESLKTESEKSTPLFNSSLNRIKEEPGYVEKCPNATLPDSWSREEEDDDLKIQRLQLPVSQSKTFSRSISISSDTRSRSPMDIPQPTLNINSQGNPATLSVSVMAAVQDAKFKFREMLKTLDPGSLAGFGAWLKRIQIYQDSSTGEIQCEESTSKDGDVSNKHKIDDVTPMDLTTTSITLNITLSPGAMSGDGPITVTASTAPKKGSSVAEPSQKCTAIKKNVEEPIDSTPTDRLTSQTNKAANPTETNASSTQGDKPSWPCPSNKRKRYASSDSIHGPSCKLNKPCQSITLVNSQGDGSREVNERTGTQIHSHQPKNYQTNSNHIVGNHAYQTNGDLHARSSNPVNTPVDPEIQRSSPAASSQSFSGAVQAASTTIARGRAEDTLTVFQPGLAAAGISVTVAGGAQMPTPSIPQAHTSLAQRLGCNPTARDLSMFIPMPLPYPGQIPPIMTNRMMHNPAMLASFANSHIPVSAHAGYLSHQSVYNSLNRGDSTGTNTSTTSTDSIN